MILHLTKTMLPVVCAVFYSVAAVAVVVAVAAAAGLMEAVQNWSHTPSNNKIKTSKYHVLLSICNPHATFPMASITFYHWKVKGSRFSDKTCSAVHTPLECQKSQAVKVPPGGSSRGRRVQRGVKGAKGAKGAKGGGEGGKGCKGGQRVKRGAKEVKVGAKGGKGGQRGVKGKRGAKGVCARF